MNRFRRRATVGAVLAGCAMVNLPSAVAAPVPGGTLDPLTIPKYVTPLVIPPVLHDDAGAPMEVEVSVRQISQQVLPLTDINGNTLPPTPLWAYGDPANPATFNNPGFTIEVTNNTMSQVTWRNELVQNPANCDNNKAKFVTGQGQGPGPGPGASSDTSCNFLPHIIQDQNGAPVVDQTLHWAAPNQDCRDGIARTDCRGASDQPYTGPIPMVTHVHGAHVGPVSDGYPEAWWLPAADNIPLGYATSGTFFDDISAGNSNRGDRGLAVFEYTNDQPTTTLWYHDHSLGITRLNVYGGMAGFYLLRDDFEDGLGLPGPAPQVGDAPGTEYFEIPLVIQDREFNPDGSLFYPPTIQNAFFGDKILVNGKVWPFLNVKQGKYRFRLLNGSQARSYALRLENQADPAQVIPFTLIGTDLGLIDGPIPLDSISEMAPAERFDVIVDFSGFQPGTEIVLRNDDPSTPLIPNVMKFVVQQGSGFTGGIPTALRPVEPIPEGDATVTRYFRLENVAESCAGNEWIVQTLDGPNGNPVSGETHWDDIIGDGLIGDTPLQLGSTEIWQFENPSNIMHPMHVHLVAFQVLDRTPIGGGQALQLEPWELNTWKDVVRVPPDTAVRVIARYEDYLGKFPTHCHILDHEDHEMMRQFQVSNDPANCNNNGACEAGEDCISCPNDCAQQSGAHCGNGLCEAGDGENCLTCAEDCAGKQKGSASKQFCCGAPGGTNNISCGDNAADNRCVDASANLFCRIAPRVKACCGDAMCEGEETEISCAVDCSAEPPQPPVCTRADPTVSISPASGEITNDGGTAGYTVNITNNDTAACADSTFNLSVSDSDTGANFVVPSTLGQDSVSLAPAANTNVSLTVTGQQQGATDGATNDSSVTAADPAANHADVTSNTVTTTINVGAGGTCEGILDRTQCRNDPTCQWKKGACVTR